VKAGFASLVAAAAAFYNEGIARPYAALSIAFLAPVFFATARFALASSARLSAQRCFVAAMIRFMPSSLIRRLASSGRASDIA